MPFKDFERFSCSFGSTTRPCVNFLALSWRARPTRLARVVTVSSPPLKKKFLSSFTRTGASHENASVNCHCASGTSHAICEYHLGRRHLLARLFQTICTRHENTAVPGEKASVSSRFSERIRRE